MKKILVIVTVALGLSSSSAFAQASASADCFATIVNIKDTAKLAEMRKAHESARVVTATVAMSQASQAIQPTIIKGDIIKMSLFSRKRKSVEKKYNSEML